MKNSFGLAGAAAALFAGVSAQDPAGPDCTAESTACAMDAACLALVTADPQDQFAIMGNTLGAAQWTCLLGGQECGAELLACYGDAVRLCHGCNAVLCREHVLRSV